MCHHGKWPNFLYTKCKVVPTRTSAEVWMSLLKSCFSNQKWPLTNSWSSWLILSWYLRFVLFQTFFPHFPTVESWAVIYKALCFCHSQGHIPSTQWMYQHFPLVLLPSRSWFLLISTLQKSFFTYLMLQLCSSRWFIPKILGGSQHHNVFVYATEEISFSASLLHANLLQSSDTAPNSRISCSPWMKKVSRT